MNKVARLALAFLREHPARVTLTSIATVAATCLVIWVAAGYDSLLATFDVWANKALGEYELSIAPISNDAETYVPQEVVAAIVADPSVEAVEAFWILSASVQGNRGTSDAVDLVDSSKADERPRVVRNGPPRFRSEYTIVATSAEEPPFNVEGRWIDVHSADAMEAVLPKPVAQELGVNISDEITLTYNDRPYRLRVVGVMDAPMLNIGAYAVPQMRTPATGEVFLSAPVASQIFEADPRISFLGVSMKPEADLTSFRFGWAPKLSRFATPVQFQEAVEIEEALDESAAADNVRLQSYAATGVAMLVALLVIFCTVNMGVSERVRQLAILRAVVLTRLQVCMLIFSESLLLATIGFVGGIIVGWLTLKLVAIASSGLLHHGALVGEHSLMLAAIATYGGATLAAAIPAYRAIRVRPIDAMTSVRHSFASSDMPRTAIVCGLLLICVNPLLTFFMPPRSEREIPLLLGIGFMSMAVGFVLVAPAVVAVVDRFCGPVLARLLRIKPSLLQSQITMHVWRTVASAISMAVGLGLFIGVQVWGFTMLDGFLVGPWAPDAVLAFPSGGLPIDRVHDVARTTGVDREQCLPIVVEQPRLLDDLTGSADRASVTRQDNVVIVGIDPSRALGGTRPLFVFEWVEGNPDQAISEMLAGRACIVPDHFLTESGLKVGDGFDLVPPENASAPVRYTIAGAVRMPGWHWQTKLTGFRSRTHRAAALVFANYGFVADDFALPAATHLWFNFDRPKADGPAIAAAATNAYNEAVGSSPGPTRVDAEEQSARLIAVDDIRQMTRNNASRWIWLVSQLPLIATVIASFGVLNVILASVRARRWEYGVLRAIGISQSSIVRAILAEGMMVGIVTGLLSLAFGILAGWCGCGMAQYISFFGGLHPDLNVPWLPIAVAVPAVIVLSILAALWPALSVGRTRPLALLQQGRMAY